MFGSIGGPEILMILVLALLLFGPRNLPKMGRTLGRAMGEFRRATHEFRSTLEREVEAEELKETKDSVLSAQREITDSLREASGLGVPRGSLADRADAGKTPVKPAAAAAAAPTPSTVEDSDSGSDERSNR
jgi:Tat protein translocase TatB subunit